MFYFKYTVVFLFVIKNTVYGAIDLTCDPFDESKGCKCNVATSPQTTSQIVCSGDYLTDDTLYAFGQAVKNDGYLLYINNAKNLTNIKSGTFNQTTFEQIFIENNSGLTSIANNTFKESNRTVNLVIRNNPTLKGDELFELASRVGHSLTDIEFQSNNIEIIPENAFNRTDKFQKVSHLRLDSQKALKTIGKNAFANLPSLKSLALNHNNITNVNETIIDLKNNKNNDLNNGHIVIYLQDNRQLTALSNTSIILPDDKDLSVGLVLENCGFDDLPQIAIKVMNTTGGKLFLSGNKIGNKCNCTDLQWLTTLLSKDQNLKNNIQGLEEYQCTTFDENKATIINCPLPSSSTTTTKPPPTTTTKAH